MNFLAQKWISLEWILKFVEMKHLHLLAIIFIAMASSLTLNAQNNEKYIEVHGTAEKKVSPDIITLSITIHENDYRKRSLDRLEKDMKSALTKAGIDIQSSLKVEDMSSSFIKKGLKNSATTLSKSFVLKVSDASSANKAILALDEVDISNVNITKAEYSKMDELKIAIKVDAIKNAKEIATAMTGAIDQKLGPAIYIYEQEVYTENTRPVMMAKSMAYDSMEENAIEESTLEFQEIKVTSRVTVRFSLN